MKPIYEIDFSVLNENEKVEFMYDLYDSMEAGFQEIQFPIQLLAQTLIFTRWWNSYKYMAPNEPTPQILETAIELLWDFQEEKCDPKTFARFQKSLSDSALEILTGDDSELNADSESEAFIRGIFNSGMQCPMRYSFPICVLYWRRLSLRKSHGMPWRALLMGILGIP